jgi:hypothetical protein
MSETDIRIGHSGDAINLIDELLSEENQKLAVRDYCKKLEEGLKALKDAIERGIV